MTIFLGVVAVILLIGMIGMIGDKEPQNRRNYAECFMITVAAIAVITILS